MKNIKERFIDEKTGIEYIRCGNYFLPNLIYIGKTVDMIENEKIIKFRDAPNLHSGMHETYTPECTKPAPHYNKKYKNNNIYNNINSQNKSSNYQGRSYKSEELEKLYANYN